MFVAGFWETTAVAWSGWAVASAALTACAALLRRLEIEKRERRRDALLGRLHRELRGAARTDE